MAISFRILNKDIVTDTDEFLNVVAIARELETFLNSELTQYQILTTHRINAKSSEIQKILEHKAEELGFVSEKRGLFSNYSTSGLRPDYYRRLDDKKGIIMEVERGKTIINNMDLLDIWKCHLCEEANYIFLVVPKFRQTSKGSNSTVFNTVVSRLQSFFIPKNYIDVDGAFIFGY